MFGMKHSASLIFLSFYRLEVLQVGDRIIGINGVRMDGVLLQQALKFVQEAGDTIEMEVEFDVTGRSCESHVTFESGVTSESHACDICESR